MRHYILLKIVLSWAAITASHAVFAQKKLSPVGRDNYYPSIKFIINAPATLPALHKAGKLNDMENYANNWGRSPAPSGELIIALKVLIAIERKNLSVRQLPGNFLQVLDDYAKLLKKSSGEKSSFKYYIHLSGTFYTYDATSDAVKCLRFIQAWAQELSGAKQADSTSSFLCRVFAGSISKPSSYFAANKYSYAEINSYETSLDAVQQNCFVAKRNGSSSTAHILAGVWVPNGNLAVLGPHPSVGLQFGRRNKMNEFDVTWNFRFLPPSRNTYTVVRHDTAYNRNYYDGGYIGFDYTRYVIHKASFEAGLIAGIGYDYFDAFNGLGGSSTYNGHNLIPYNIGSVDFNAGLNIKWFIHRRASIGIQAKYHCINYANPGGTDLGGNAVSIDLSFGAN